MNDLEYLNRKKIRSNNKLSNNFQNYNIHDQNLNSDLLNFDDTVVFSSPQDHGVVRNFGRWGSRYSPQAILNVLKNFISSDFDFKIHCFESPSHNNKTSNFDELQTNEKNLISKLWPIFQNNFIHLGGGHDLVFPLVSSLIEFVKLKSFNNKKYSKVKILNIDAHLDTRKDSINHSGTPFRQLIEEYKDYVEVIQIGIQNFSNVGENFNIENKFMSVNMMNDFIYQDLNNDYLSEKVNLKNDELLILSLDCDAIDSSIMSAVSAVNSFGFTAREIQIIFSWYKKLEQPNIVGIYEYNPVYDNLSQKGSRLISSLIYNMIY
jgi:formiminoglutamase